MHKFIILMVGCLMVGWMLPERAEVLHGYRDHGVRPDIAR